MQVSIIIPVWNGEAVITDCLSALFHHTRDDLIEVICVENDSQDDSASIIAQNFPEVRLLRQPVNLGFAGGVNVGLQAAQGGLFVLLNQDCLVHEGWLTAVTTTFAQNPHIGIIGGTIYNPDGAVNHAGAYIRYPDGYGIHETAVPTNPEPKIVDYVNGALFAFRRSVWEENGRFDDEFYPGYFEECDYCYRARKKGFQIAYVPGIQATHLFSSREWQKDPIKHSANQHRSRYRFILKQFTDDQLNDFFAAEANAIQQPDIHIHQTIGRLLAARDTLRDQAAMMVARRQSLGQSVSREQERLVRVGFTHLLRLSWKQAKNSQPPQADNRAQIAANEQKLQILRNQEYEVLTQIYFRAPDDTEPEPLFKHLWRLLVKRFLSFITLREHLLLSKLNVLHVSRLDLLAHRQWLLEEQINQRLILLDLLENLTDYDYR